MASKQFFFVKANMKPLIMNAFKKKKQRKKNEDSLFTV